MPDDTFNRELDIRVTRLEDQVHELVEILDESGIFKDESLANKVARILIAGGSGALSGSKGGLWGIALGTTGGLIWQAGSEIISDQDNEKYAELVDQMAKEEQFREDVKRGIFESLYLEGTIGSEEFQNARDRGFAILDAESKTKLTEIMLQHVAELDPDSFSEDKAFLDYEDLAHLIPEYIDINNKGIQQIILTEIQRIFLENDAIQESFQEDRENLFLDAVEGGFLDQRILELAESKLGLSADFLEEKNIIEPIKNYWVTGEVPTDIDYDPTHFINMFSIVRSQLLLEFDMWYSGLIVFPDEVATWSGESVGTDNGNFVMSTEDDQLLENGASISGEVTTLSDDVANVQDIVVPGVQSDMTTIEMGLQAQINTMVEVVNSIPRIQDQTERLTAQNTTLAAQIWSHDVLLVSIKASLDNLNAQISALAVMADPFQQPQRLGGYQQPD